jgi:diamine N-acetyltransferase
MLLGKNIRLRQVEPSDIDFIYNMENEPSAWRISNTFVPFSRFQIEQYVLSSEHDIYAEKQLRLIIELFNGSHAQPIGAIDLFEFDPHDLRAGLGILIISDERQKGYAGETIEIVKKYCFEVLNLHQIHCTISADNTPSIHLFLKHGFVQNGTMREWRFRDGKWKDEIMFQLIRG